MSAVRPLYYVLNAANEPEPCADVVEWGARMYRPISIASAHIGRVFLSTVFIGIDHCFGDGPPVLWETMAFWREIRGGELMQWRYRSHAAALQGHESAARLIAAAPPRDLAYTAIASRSGRYWQRRANWLHRRGARLFDPLDVVRTQRFLTLAGEGE